MRTQPVDTGREAWASAKHGNVIAVTVALAKDRVDGLGSSLHVSHQTAHAILRSGPIGDAILLRSTR